MATKRRGNGEGSIFRRSDGRWVAKVANGYDASGKRRRKTVYGKTKREVQDKLTELQQRQKLGALAESKGVSIAQYLERWLEDSVRGSVRPSTHERYDVLIRNQINPHIGGVRLDRLTAPDVQAFYNDLEKAGVSPRLRQMTHNILRPALRQACRWGLIPHNVCDLVTPPKVQQGEIRFWSKEQSTEFLKDAKKDRLYALYALYVLAIATGMRQGELLGLQWVDIDLKTGTLAVRRTLIRLKGRNIIGEPKTAKSKRQIKLPSFAVDALRQHKADMLTEGNSGSPWTFCTPTGILYNRSNFVRDSFHPLLGKSDLPGIRFHDLRHTAATLLLTGGVHPKVVQERLGHSKIAHTLDIYSHVTPSMQEQAADKLDEMFDD